MHKATLEERIDFYRYTSANLIFCQARDVLKEISTLKSLDAPSWKVNSLWVSFFILYAKPFKQLRDKRLKVGLRLPDDVIPVEFRNDHDAIIDLRDKMFAHTDFSSLKDNLGRPLNELVICVHGSRVQFATRFIQPTQAGIEKYLKLLDEVIKTVDYRGTKIWERWSKHLNLADSSVWVVNAADGTDDALLPLRRGQ
jgi:hypothetical protein